MSASSACWARRVAGRGRLVSRYQVLCPGRRPGSVVATTSRSAPVRSPAAKLGVGRPPGLGVAVTEAAGHPPPPAGLGGSLPAEVAGRLDRGVGRLGRRPGALAGLEGQHERDPGGAQRVGEAGVVAIGTVGHHRPEPDAGLQGGLDQLHGQLRLGLEPGIPLAGRQPRGRGVGHGVHRPVAALVGPQAGHGDDAVVDLADRAEILAGHMRGGGAVLAVAGVIDHQHARRGGRWPGPRTTAAPAGR